VILSVVSKNLLSLSPRAIAVTDDLKPRLDLSDKRQRRLKVSSVAKERDRLADNIPRRPKCAASGRRFCDYLPGSLMVPIFWIETCKEERCVAKQPRWKCHLPVYTGCPVQTLLDVR